MLVIFIEFLKPYAILKVLNIKRADRICPRRGWIFRRFRGTIGAFHEWADDRLDPDLLAVAAELLTATGSAGCFRTLDRQLGLYLLHAHPICRVSFSARRGARESCWMPIGRVPRSRRGACCTIAGTPDFHELSRVAINLANREIPTFRGIFHTIFNARC